MDINVIQLEASKVFFDHSNTKKNKEDKLKQLNFLFNSYPKEQQKLVFYSVCNYFFENQPKEHYKVCNHDLFLKFVEDNLVEDIEEDLKTF